VVGRARPSAKPIRSAKSQIVPGLADPFDQRPAIGREHVGQEHSLEAEDAALDRGDLALDPIAQNRVHRENKSGFVYTNNAEPISEDEHVISGTVSGAIELAAEDSGDEELVIDKVFVLVGGLVEPFGGECTECRLTDRQAPAPRTEDAGSGLTPSPF
jgi:hypothetical protein